MNMQLQERSQTVFNLFAPMYAFLHLEDLFGEPFDHSDVAHSLACEKMRKVVRMQENIPQVQS